MAPAETEPLRRTGRFTFRRGEDGEGESLNMRIVVSSIVVGSVGLIVILFIAGFAIGCHEIEEGKN